MAEVNLHDANGGYVGKAELGEEPNRDAALEVDGKTYVWNQRNAQYREVAGSVKAKLMAEEKDEPKAPSAEGKVLSSASIKEPERRG